MDANRRIAPPMQRLVLAILIVACAAFALVAVAGAARRVWGSKGGGEPMRRGGDVMQRISFFLLIALILYVSVLGGA